MKGQGMVTGEVKKVKINKVKVNMSTITSYYPT